MEHLSKGDDGADRASRWMSRSGADSDYNGATDLSWKLGSGDDVTPRLSAFYLHVRFPMVSNSFIYLFYSNTEDRVCK